MLIVQLIIIQTIVFGIVIYILKKLLYGDTQSAVNRLNDSYKEIQKKKEELTQKIGQIEAEYEKRKEAADKVANEYRDKAEKEMYAKSDALIKKAHEEAERIVLEAATAKDKIRAEIRKEEEINLVIFCEQILDKTLKGIMRDNIDAVIVENFINELKEADLSHIPGGTTEIEIVTRKPMTDDARKRIQEMLDSKLTKKYPIKEAVDPEIVGGVVLRFGTLILDGSLSGKIREYGLVKKQEIEAVV